MNLAQLYDRHAADCAREAEQADDPKHRAMLIKFAAEWRQAAQAQRQSMQQPNTDEKTNLRAPVFSLLIVTPQSNHLRVESQPPASGHELNETHQN